MFLESLEKTRQKNTIEGVIILKEVLLLGLGAVGASIAAQFYDAGYPINIICDADRKARYSRDGFSVNNKNYKFTYFTNREYKKSADLVLIAVKYHHLKDALPQLEGLIGEKTVIVSLLNGIDSEEIISNYFKCENNIAPAFIYKIDATKVNNAVNYYSKGIIVFGEKNGMVTEKINKVKNIFDRAGIKYEISDNILKKIWWKYMTNIGFNQTTAILKVPYRALQEIQYAQELAKEAMNEVVLISQSTNININLSKEDISRAMEMLKQLDPDGKTSMMQDVEAKRKTEVEMFSGKLCQMGDSLNISTPINRMLYNLIRTIEETY